MLPFEQGSCKSKIKIMSDKGSSSDKNEQAPDLSALDFGPAWARADQGKKGRGPGKGKSHAGSRSKPSRPSKAKEGGKPDHNRSDGRQQRRSGSDREHRGGPRKGRGRNDYSKGAREQKHVVAAPEGVKARIMPIEEGLDAMAKQITATGRTHSVFDLAWLVLGSLDRFHVIFEGGEQDIYRSKTDHSVWHTQKECISHFVSSELINKYYDEEITEVDPPSGNFQSVARCGLSKKLIGPPNHHGYQQALIDLHRERFSSMPIERYKSKVIMEHGEEAVQEWMDSMCKQKRWRPKAEQPDEQAAEAEQKEVLQEASEQEQLNQSEATPAEQVAEPEVASHEEDSVEHDAAIPADEQPADDVEAQPDAAAEAESKVDAGSEVKDEGQSLANHREVEQHFLEHGFEKEFYQGKSVSALANIPARMISPGLMTLLKETVSEEKRYPGNLASILCRQMSGRHLAVYKWKKRLHCGPARPRHASKDLIMADRPTAMFQWVVGHPGANIDELWKDCLPADIDDATRHTWYHDLHWLINEGLVLLLSDGTIHAAKEQSVKQEPKQEAVKKTAKKVAKKAVKKSAKKSAQQPKAAGGDEDDAKAEGSDDAKTEASGPEGESTEQKK